MAIIDGIEVFMSSAEFAEHCRRRAEFHAKRNEFYLAKAAEIRDERRAHPNPTFDADDSPKGVSYGRNSGHSDPVAELEQTAASHRNRAERFRFMADHTRPDDVYQLSSSDMALLEIGA